MTMPRAARPCAHPGCTVRPRGGADRCSQHKRRPNPQTSSWRRGYDARWRRTRAAYLAAHPRCQVVGCTQPAREVDHVDGLGPLAARGHDWSNLRGMCKRHHAQRTARDQPGGWYRRQQDGGSGVGVRSRKW